MRHFVAYHNTERMGRSLRESDPLTVLSSKPVERLLHNTVWIVVGEGSSPRRYSLGSVFVVDDCGLSGVDGFKNYARGQGQLIDPPTPLNEQEWFPQLIKTMANFSLGVQELKEPLIIEALIGLQAAGC